MVGVLTLVGGVVVWVWFTVTPPTIRAVFHVSMFFGLVACYAIIATGLGFRATERVEAHVVENVEHADEVEVRDRDH